MRCVYCAGGILQEADLEASTIDVVLQLMSRLYPSESEFNRYIHTHKPPLCGTHSPPPRERRPATVSLRRLTICLSCLSLCVSSTAVMLISDIVEPLSGDETEEERAARIDAEQQLTQLVAQVNELNSKKTALVAAEDVRSPDHFVVVLARFVIGDDLISSKGRFWVHRVFLTSIARVRTDFSIV